MPISLHFLSVLYYINKCRENRIMLKFFYSLFWVLKIIFRALGWEKWYRPGKIRTLSKHFISELHKKVNFKVLNVVIQNHSFISKVHVRNLPLPSVQESNVQALEILFTYHGSDLLPHRLVILSNFPETTSPHEYSILLPEAWYVLCSLNFTFLLSNNFCFMLNILN